MKREKDWLDRLMDLGFEPAGRWISTSEGLTLKLDTMSDAKPALYAFVMERRVMYVGKTRVALSKRLGQYASPHRSQKTNTRVHATLARMVTEVSDHVLIYGFQVSMTMRFGDFRLDIPAGLETSIINEIAPPWNLQ